MLPRRSKVASAISGSIPPAFCWASSSMPPIFSTPADIQHADSAWTLLKRIKHLYCWLKVVFADSIYNRLPVLLAYFLLGLTLIIVRRIAGTTGFVVIPRRGIVERTLGWLGRWRRLSKDAVQRL